MRPLSVFLMVLAACGGAAEDDVGTGDDVAPLLAGEKLSVQTIAGYLRDAGFDERDVAPMVCTAKYESSFYTEALHKNSNGSVDYGLFQINDQLWARKCGLTIKGLYDPAKNAHCAKRVFDSGGLTSWYGYKKHRPECDRYVLPSDP